MRKLWPKVMQLRGEPAFESGGPVTGPGSVWDCLVTHNQVTSSQSDQIWNQECTEACHSPKEAPDPSRGTREGFLEEEVTTQLRRWEVRML